MKLTGAQKTLFGVLLTAVFFTGMGSASYYFGVKTIDTEGIAKLNTGIAGIKQQLADANASNSALTSANADLTTKLGTATESNTALDTALKARFKSLKDLATLLSVPNVDTTYPDDGYKTDATVSALVNAISTQAQALKDSSGSGDSGQAALDAHLNDLIALANVLHISTTQYKTPATQADIDKLSDVVKGGLTGLNNVFTKLGITPDGPDPAAAVQNAVTEALTQVATQAATLAVTAFTGTINAIGTDVAWVTTGPTYNPIVNPAVLFGSGEVQLVSVPVGTVTSTANGAVKGDNTTAVLPVLKNTSVNGVSLLWNGYGWVITNDPNNPTKIYIDKTTTDSNGKTVAAGISWVNTTDVFSKVDIGNGDKRLLLWGSNSHNFIKAFVPDFSALFGSGGYSGSGIITWPNSSGTDDVVNKIKVQLQNPPSGSSYKAGYYTLDLLPNYANAGTDHSKYTDIRNKFTDLKLDTGSQDTFIQNTPIFKTYQ